MTVLLSEFEFLLERGNSFCIIQSIVQHGSWLSLYVDMSCAQMDLFLALFTPLYYSTYVTTKVAIGFIIGIKVFNENLSTICY